MSTAGRRPTLCLHDQVTATNATVAPPPADPTPTGGGNTEAGFPVALRWLAWALGLALLWYVLGFATHLIVVNISGAPARERLALPLYPYGYGRLFVGALVASTVIGLLGRRASRVYPAGVLAAGVSWALARAGLPSGPRSVLGNDLLVLFGTTLLAVATLVGLTLGVWGARVTWRRLVALSVLAAVTGTYLVGSFLELRSGFGGQPALSDTGSLISRWLTLAALFGLAFAIGALGKAPWLLPTAASSVLLPVSLTVLGYLRQLIGPGVAGNVVERILAPIADLVPAVLSTSTTWWPPLAVLAGGAVGLLLWQARRSQRADVPVLDQPIP